MDDKTKKLLASRREFANKAPKTQQGLEDYIKHLGDAFRSIEGDHIMKWMAPTLESCDYNNSELVVSYMPQERLSNPSGIVLHGGMTAAYLDTAMGSFATFYAVDMVDTISLSVDYTAPILVEKEVFVRVKKIKDGRKIIFLTAELFQKPDTQKVLATAKGTFFAHEKRGLV